MTPEDQNIADALRLEEIEFIEAGRDTAAANEAAIRAMTPDAARKGVATSGGRYKAELEIRFGGARGLIEKAIAKRASLGSKLPEMLTPARLRELEQRLNQSLSAIVQNQYDRMARDRADLMPATLEALNRSAEQMADRLRDTITHAIERLTLEKHLGVNEGSQLMTLNISFSEALTFYGSRFAQALQGEFVAVHVCHDVHRSGPAVSRDALLRVGVGCGFENSF